MNMKEGRKVYEGREAYVGSVGRKEGGKEGGFMNMKEGRCMKEERHM